MKTVSDVIEEFILSMIGEDELVSLSRNQLAEHFDCSPSQINYVLSTRFTFDKGYLIESKRGGGGYVTVIKVGEDEKNSYIHQLIDEELKTEISYSRAIQIVSGLMVGNFINESEAEIIKNALSDKALFVPKNLQGIVRASILRNILMGLTR